MTTTAKNKAIDRLRRRKTHSERRFLQKRIDEL
jgi:DNA-directed RNA polymerase specialized sigma24 family protein